MKYAVELEKISKYFGRHHVLKDISLKFEAGKLYILLGKNGAGKSTLMRMLMRYEQPDSGSGTVIGKPLLADRDDLNLGVGYVSESLDYALPLKVGKLFKYFSEIYPNWDQALFNGILSELQIDQDQYFKELSRGQKMQVAFTAALATHPKLLLLDEITAVLDANARAFFMDYLGRFCAKGGTVVLATNIVSEAHNHATHMVLLNDGRVALDIAFDELSNKFMKLRRSAGEDAPVFKDSDCVEVCLNSDGSTSHLITRERALTYPHVENLSDKRGITAEEIFIYFTRSKRR